MGTSSIGLSGLGNRYRSKGKQIPDEIEEYLLSRLKLENGITTKYSRIADTLRIRVQTIHKAITTLALQDKICVQQLADNQIHLTLAEK